MNYISVLALIYLRIAVDELPTVNVILKNVNRKSRGAIGTREGIKSSNVFVNNLQTKAYEAHRYPSENEKSVTAETLKK